MKILQANVGRGREATEAVRLAAEERDADVVALQEPYRSTHWMGWQRFGKGKSLIMCKSVLQAIKMRQHSTGNQTAVKVEKPGEGDVTIISVYVEPGGAAHPALGTLEALVREEDGPLVIAGDLNAKHEAWGRGNTDERGAAVMDLVGAANLEVLNDRESEPTFETVNGRSWIDVTLARGVTATGWEVCEEDILSDHRLIQLCVEGGGGVAAKGPRRLATARTDWDRFRQVLQQSECLRADGPPLGAEEQAVRLQKAALSALRSSTPWSRSGATRGNSWWNDGLERSRREVHRAREKYQREPNPVLRAEHEEDYREKRRAYKKRIKDAKIQDFRETLEAADPTDPWGLAHRIIAAGKKKKGTAWETVQDETGRWTTGRRSTAEALIRKYFPVDDASIDSREDSVCRAANVRWNPANDRRISLWELTDTIRKRPKRKAPGIDGFPTSGLKPLLDEAGGKLNEVFNACLQEGVFPKIWKRAIIAWIPKPGGSGLRPICLLPTIGKVLDKILASRLAHHLEKTGRLSERQFGFRRGRGTTEALRRVVQGLRAAKARGSHALLVALDIKNAFNSAWYPKLRQQLAASGCPGNLGRTIADFLEGRTVVSEGATVATERGCPQGSCLGPILWLLVMEDWFAAMAEITPHQSVEIDVQAFADDQLVMITGPSIPKIEEAWSQAWEKCRGWATANRLEYAPQKTTAIFAPAKNMVKAARVRMDGVVVVPQYSMKYLGVCIDRKLLWVDQAVYLRGRVSAAAHRVRAVAGKKWGTKPSILREIYLRAIRPALLYGAEVWGERWNDLRVRRHLTAAQRPFLLGVCRAYRTTSNMAIQVLSGCMPLHLESRARYVKAVEWYSDRSEGPIRAEREPHPAQPKRIWRVLEEVEASPEDTWMFADASRSGEHVGVGIVVRSGAAQKEVRGIRLPAGYPVHAAELYAVWSTLRVLALLDRPAVGTINLVSDSKVALALVCERKGGIGQEVDWRLRLLEEAGTPVRLWWNDGSSDGLLEADRLAKRTREDPEAIRDPGWVTKKMARQRARRESSELWQANWTTTADKGRLTFSVCPQVEEKLRGWTSKSVSLLTGHGPFRAYFRRFRLKEGNGLCDCGDAADDGNHALRQCELPERAAAREEFRRDQERRGAPYPFSVSPETTDEEVTAFNLMAESMFLSEEEDDDSDGGE